MCTKENLTVFLLGINTVLMLSAVTLTLVGVLLLLDDDWAIAYQGTPSSWGGGLLFAAFVLTSSACTAFYGTKKHNKCFLIFSVFTGIGTVLVQYSVAQNIAIWLDPSYPIDDWQLCVESGDEGLYPSEYCDELFAAPDVVAVQHLWMFVYNASLDDEARKAELVRIETESYCCGLGPAEKCDGEVVNHPNFTLWGDEIRNAQIPIEAQLRRCSARQPQVWYTESFYCQVPAGDLFGCPYQFSVSTSCLRDSTIRKGCLRAMQEHVSSQVSPIISVIWTLVAMQVSGILAAFCLFLKRKAHDVLPPPDKFVDPRFAKYGRENLKEPNHSGPAEVKAVDDV